jgi:hypothetical protein
MMKETSSEEGEPKAHNADSPALAVSAEIVSIMQRNTAVKQDMSRRLHVMGIPAETISRILHVPVHEVTCILSEINKED